MFFRIRLLGITLLIVLLSLLALVATLGRTIAAPQSWQARSPDTTLLNTTLLSNVVQIATGSHHTCALLNNGEVKCWGRNGEGQLGDGLNVDQSIPVDVLDLSDVKSIQAGEYHTCALLNNNQVKCWGDNGHGRLGNGDTNDRTLPTEVAGLTSGVVAIDAGDYHTCALLSIGHVKCWGGNSHSQVGDGVPAYQQTPSGVKEISSGSNATIVAGGGHTCIAFQTGATHCWGDNEFGQLGNSSEKDFEIPSVVSHINNVQAIAAGDTHTCGWLGQGSGLYCWGDNQDKQLGLSGGWFIEPQPLPNAPSDVLSLTAGKSHTCVTRQSGGVQCWGKNDFGQLGDGTRDNRNTPTDVAGLNSVSVTVAGGATYLYLAEKWCCPMLGGQ